MEPKVISRAVVERLPRYYRYLGELMENKAERVSSGELSEMMHITASQIRQDLNHFGGFGQQGYGYNVEYLYNEIGKILGLNQVHRMIIIGAGHLGQAIANYGNFERRGFRVVGMFDQREELAGTLSPTGVPIYHMDTLEDFVAGHPVSIAVLAIPKAAAVEVARKLVACGVRAFWNFAHTDLDVPPDVVVENVHLSESLMRLSYNMNMNKE